MYQSYPRRLSLTLADYYSLRTLYLSFCIMDAIKVRSSQDQRQSLDLKLVYNKRLFVAKIWLSVDGESRWLLVQWNGALHSHWCCPAAFCARFLCPGCRPESADNPPFAPGQRGQVRSYPLWQVSSHSETYVHCTLRRFIHLIMQLSLTANRSTQTVPNVPQGHNILSPSYIWLSLPWPYLTLHHLAFFGGQF